MWVGEAEPATAGATTGLTKVVELDGCCREVAGTKTMKLSKAKLYYIMGRVKEGGGGEYLDVGLQKTGGKAPTGCAGAGGGGSAKMMPMPLSMFDTSKTFTKGNKCGGSVCKYFWFGIGGVKIPNLTNNAKYKTFTPDLAMKMTDGTFQVTGNEIPSDNNMASMLEGYVKAPEDGDYIFLTRRSVCGLHSQTAAPAVVRRRSLLSLAVSAPRSHAHIALTSRPTPAPAPSACVHTTQ